MEFGIHSIESRIQDCRALHYTTCGKIIFHSNYNNNQKYKSGALRLRKFRKPIKLEYRKIPKISPRAYIFQRPFLRGFYSEGLIYGGKFAFQNRLG